MLTVSKNRGLKTIFSTFVSWILIKVSTAHFNNCLIERWYLNFAFITCVDHFVGQIFVDQFCMSSQIRHKRWTRRKPKMQKVPKQGQDGWKTNFWRRKKLEAKQGKKWCTMMKKKRGNKLDSSKIKKKYLWRHWFQTCYNTKRVLRRAALNDVTRYVR